MTKVEGIVLAYFVCVEYGAALDLLACDYLENATDAFCWRILIVRGVLRH